MKFSKLFIFLFAICLFFSQSLQAQTPVVIDKIIAKVDNHYILKSELESQVQQYKQSGQAGAPSSCQIFESLVVGKMMLAKSEIDSITVDDKRVETELSSRMEQMEQQFGSQKNIVEAYGKSISSLKDELRSAIKEQLTTRKMQEKITSDVKITPKEVRRFFESIPKDSIPYMPSEVEIGHIVRLAKTTKAQKDELYKRLNDYKRRVENGESFEELAKLYSEDLGSGKRGGDLGFAKRGQMVAPFEAAALKLKPNELSGVVESEFGYHLIKMLEVRGQEYHALHILLRPDYQRLDVQEPTRFLDSIRVLIQRDSIKFERAAKDFSEDKATQDAGGMITDPQTRSIKMALDGTMESGLYFTIDSMTVGTITAPMPYRTEDGRSAMRILYYKAKHPPHYANLEDDFQRMSTYALNRKRNTAIEKWFATAKNDVFIYIVDEYKECNVMKTNDQ
ncbi:MULTISPECIES: peptidylprolyl isomerase [unclassified Arcicella]|uniref:peptidylprolyl isomerase n=1 Tax=unclassified Arcicella TaxID=2644986 RepID=UPI00285E85A9|nr:MULTISPECIES: peptidylprolyl isomerase [unclassified Arcicella]MDR6559964.1 peptidyl-prolyl cis-trans isomerase SurA [Arcicella sp. BE51]MDR6810429.1 peptidyl-prolyl cis-trans isomerase SurA [Arcicella sp. BE140]MDR6821779.1 peptidyl-prolyl cis-trans isomerase SurA [Arcicella sp. BE139]